MLHVNVDGCHVTPFLGKCFLQCRTDKRLNAILCNPTDKLTFAGGKKFMQLHSYVDMTSGSGVTYCTDIYLFCHVLRAVRATQLYIQTDNYVNHDKEEKKVK